MVATFRILLFFIVSTQLWSNATTFAWYTQGPDKKVALNVELFLSSTCPHCHKADAFFKAIEPTTPWLHVKRNIINQDKDALIRFSQFLNEQHFNDFAVPSIFFCNSRWVGFESADTTGKDLLKALNYCKQQIEKKDGLNDTSVNVLKRWANANVFNTNMTEQPSTAQYVFVVSLLDSFNPCSLFGFAAFWALLFIQDNKKNQLLTGILFILAVGMVHYVQQAQPNIFFQLLAWIRLPAILIGGMGLYFVALVYRQQRINPYLLVTWSFVFALVIHSYQQSCVMNWSFIFEQWLLNQPISNGQAMILQLIYQLLYISPLIILLLLYLMLANFKFISKRSALSSLIGLLFIAFISLSLIIYPLLLSYYLASFIILLGLIILGWAVNRHYEKIAREENN